MNLWFWVVEMHSSSGHSTIWDLNISNFDMYFDGENID